MSLGGDNLSHSQPKAEEANGRPDQPPPNPDPMYHQQYGGYQPPPGPIDPPHVMHQSSLPPDQVSLDTFLNPCAFVLFQY